MKTGRRSAVSELDRALKNRGGRERAEFEKGYLRSSLVHYGVRVPVIRKEVKSWRTRFGAESHEDTLYAAERMWEAGVHELRMAAAFLLQANVPNLEPSALELVERLLRESGTWALVDNLAVHTAGPLLERRPDADRVVERWGSDEDFWMRRAALLVHLGPLRSGGGDWGRFTGLADRMLEEKEFFVRKAVGWCLRDAARLRPDMVYEWLLPRAGRASGTTVREAVKRMPPEQAAAVMKAYNSP